MREELVFLIGARGTGKTTVARVLAQRLGWDWKDADAELQQRHGRTIRDIFASEGEAGFRAMEAAILKELCSLRNHVIATGGGVVLDAANRERIRQAGQVVWLTADAETLWQRLQGDPTTADRRPNLTIGGQAEIEETSRIREPLYRACADEIVSTVGVTPDWVADTILTKLQVR